MMNRLLLSWSLRLLLLAGLFSWTTRANAQSYCESPGDLFTLSYSGPDTFFVGNTCTDTLFIGTGSLTVSPTPSSLIYSAALTGYSLGSQVPSGTTVTLHYIAIGGGIEDTLCFDLVFADTMPPAMNYTPTSDTVDCGSANFTAWWQSHMGSIMAYATDNCTVDTFYHSAPDTIVDNCGMFVDTFFVTDNAGNIASAVATYTIEDTIAPVLTGVPADVMIACDDPIPPAPTVTALDACAGAVPALFTQDTIQVDTGACATYNYNIKRTWTATDGCGNTIDSSQVIQVRDTEAPDFQIPADLTLDCTANTDTLITGGISNISDNCDAGLTVAFAEAITPGGCPQEMTIVRTWIVTDACGNSRTKQQTITVEDNTPPVAIFPADITVDCDSVDSLSLTGQPTAILDDCDTAATVSTVDVIIAGLCTNSFTIERTWTVMDACGNFVDSMQVITITDISGPVIDDPAQELTIDCGAGVDPGVVFDAWVASHANAVANDNCTPTSTLTWTAYNTGTLDTATLAAPDCGNLAPGVFRTRTVDFVAKDECGNTATTTATFTVMDTYAPVITNCPPDITIEADPGACEALRTLPLPTVVEDCGNVLTPFSFSMNEVLTTPPGSDPVETPVNDVVFDFAGLGPPYSTVGNVSLKISLNGVDAESPTEYLNVFGENNIFLAQVAHTPAQCGDTISTITISGALFDQWAFDGTVTITVTPNIPANQPGRFSVNPICPGGNVTAELTFDANFPTNLEFEYSINGGARTSVAPIAALNEFIGQGLNTITYFFTDCVGNESSCSYDITVEDKEPPSIICPADQTISLSTGVCEEAVEVPLYITVTDNCGITPPTTQTQPVLPADRLITFSYNPNLNDFVAEDKAFIFTGLPGNATPGSVALTITIQGDVDSTGEYFEIYDQDGNMLGTTAPGQPHVTPGDCNNPGIATFYIPATTFNDWATAGDIQFTAVSFMGFPIPPAGPGWGINPCDTSQVHGDGDTDGSFIFATISYESVTPTFSASGATTVDPVQLTPPLAPGMYTLNQGTTTFTYQVDDLAGNKGACSFDITVEDNEAPVAICGPTFVDINPSGFVVDTIFSAEIDLGSTDNCSIASMTVTPNLITCNSPATVDVTLTVTDATGNVSTCSTFVSVANQVPQPTVVSNCGSNDLQLFANPPASPGGGTVFQYTWYKPTGIPFAFVENPVVLDANLDDLGFYIVEIEGVTGCTSQASVQVTCDLLPLQKPLAQPVSSVICEQDDIELTTPAVCGTTVQYKWYTGTAPNGMLAGTTTQPAFSMTPPASGTYNFYVIVERNGCNSEPSGEASVVVNMTPSAIPEQTNLVLCAGEQILLNSINNPPGTICHWTGPCGFESFSCSPAPINNSTACNGGLYELVVSNSGCESAPAFVAVNVVAIPEQPSVTNSTTANNPACDGESVTLTATPIPGAISYQWTTPMFTQISSPANVLTIQNADLTKDAGVWTVKAIGNPCQSLPSAPTIVYVVPLPESVTSAINPAGACEGQNVQLSASSATQNVSYLWTYPDAQTDATPNPVLENVNSGDAGAYNLTVTSQYGCPVQQTVNLTVFNRVNITGASSDAPECVSGPVDVNLAATLFPIDPGSYVYQWTGPGGFSSVNANAVISNAVTGNSGPYTLVVTNADGCSSLPATVDVAVPEVLPTPGVPVLSGTNPFCEGNNITLTTTPFPGPGAEYIWNTPSGMYTTTTPSLSFPNATVTDGGMYKVYYQVGNCPSGESGSVNLVVNTAPLIQPSGNSPVCEGDVIELNVNCSAGAMYEWSGPGGFSSSVCNPVVTNADPVLHAGTYSVRKKLDGCWSEVAAININVKEKPGLPVAINAGPYCASTENVMVSVTANSATPGAMYNWFDANGEPVGGATASLNFNIPDPGQYGDGSFEFYAVATLDGCPSQASIPTVVVLNTVPPNLAEAGPNIDACDGDILNLQATPPTIGTGMWSLLSGNPNGVTIANPGQAGTTVAGLIPGQDYIFQWTLSNGACVDYSYDQVSAFVNAIETADAGTQISACFTTTVSLDALEPVSNVGSWSQPQTQSQLGVVIVDPFDPATPIIGLVPGNEYVFTWTIDGGCGTSSDVVQVLVSNESAFAGNDYIDCGDGCTVLNAVPALSGNGLWTSPDAAIEFSTPASPGSTVCNLSAGRNILVWTINDGLCGSYSVDSVLIDYIFAPQAVDDVASVKFGGETTLNAVGNDLIPGDFTFNIIQEPLHGMATFDNFGNVTYQADVKYIGPDELVYEVCVENCECATAVITLQVGENATCDVPSIITPNHDGINDAFIVPCLSDGDKFPTNVVSIFNQWGDEVFHAEPYLNNWEGTFDGEDLPAGTYFYIIDTGTGGKPMSGYLILQR
jgi:gliding motility-associated-like protein